MNWCHTNCQRDLRQIGCYAANVLVLVVNGIGERSKWIEGGPEPGTKGTPVQVAKRRPVGLLFVEQGGLVEIPIAGL